MDLLSLIPAQARVLAWSGRVLAFGAALFILFANPAQAQKKMAPARNDGSDAVPTVDLKNDQLASRFLAQATAGATPADIAALATALGDHPQTAFADWINAQFAKPVNNEDLSLTVFRGAYANDSYENSYRVHATDAAAIRASLMLADNNNELRRKIAYALSQIFVISDQDNNNLAASAEGLCDWYDMLYRDAFTDFSTLLTDVTYHPIMGEFLSMAGNAKAGFFNAASRPDENYAREVMQLFTIGLIQLNADGSAMVDRTGRTIPTYTQGEITEVARVFTGLKYPEGDSMTRGKGPDGTQIWKPKHGPLRYGVQTIDEKRHDNQAKTMLGVTLPAGQGTAKDIADMLHVLCTHPNTAPFFARGMIQRLVTSNPSPAYIRRVVQAFVSSKGDMKATISAILLDEEARDPSYARKEEYGKLREPWLRICQLARGFGAKPADTQPAFPVYSSYLLPRLAQFPLSAPSVFNFYLPNYQSPGIVSERNMNAADGATLLVAPEFQIVNSNTALLTPNLLMDLIKYESGKSRPNKQLFGLDLTPQADLAADSAALVDNVSTVLTGGMMSENTRNVIVEAVNRLTPTKDPNILKSRARMAIYLTMISPDYAVQK